MSRLLLKIYKLWLKLEGEVLLRVKEIGPLESPILFSNEVNKGSLVCFGLIFSVIIF